MALCVEWSVRAMETEGAARAADRISQSSPLDEQTYLGRYADVAAEVAAGRWASGREHYLARGQAEGRRPGPPGIPLDADLTPRARSGVELFARHNGAAYLAPDDLTVTEVHPRRIAMVGSCLLDQWRLHEGNPSGCAVDFFLTNNMARLPELDRDQIRAWDFQLVQLPLRGVLHDHLFWRLSYADAEGHRALLDQAKRTIDALLDAQMTCNREHGLLTFACNFLVPQKNPDGALLPRHDGQAGRAPAPGRADRDRRAPGRDGAELPLPRPLLHHRLPGRGRRALAPARYRDPRRTRARPHRPGRVRQSWQDRFRQARSHRWTRGRRRHGLTSAAWSALVGLGAGT